MCTVFSRQLLWRHASKGSDLKTFQFDHTNLQSARVFTLSRRWAQVYSSRCWRTVLSAVPTPRCRCLNLFHFFLQNFQLTIFNLPPALALPPPRQRPSWPILSSCLCNSISVQVMMALISMETLGSSLKVSAILRSPHIWHLVCGERTRNSVAWWLNRKTTGIYCCQAERHFWEINR